MKTWIVAAVAAMGLVSTAARADYLYLTDFTKTVNIANNLNREYPNTGFTAGGSVTGNPNATYLYDPTTYTVPDLVVTGNRVTNGVPFLISSDAAGHDFVQLYSASATVNAGGVTGVTSLHLLTAAYYGTNATVTITGTLGTTQMFGSFYIPDFNGGGVYDTSPNPGQLSQSVLQVVDTGAGGTGNSTNGSYNNYFLYEQSLTVDPALTAEGIASVTFTSPGTAGLLLGATAVVVPEPGAGGMAVAGIAAMGLRRRRR